MSLYIYNLNAARVNLSVFNIILYEENISTFLSEYVGWLMLQGGGMKHTVLNHCFTTQLLFSSLKATQH